MTRTLSATLALFTTLSIAAIPALAQDAKAPAQSQSAPEATPAPDVPGPEHTFLTKRAGAYTTKTTFRASPDAEPEESTGAATITAILDGRFIAEDNTGAMGDYPFSGHRVMGFNNKSGRFEATWYYSNSTAVLVLVGESTDLGRTIDLKGSFEGAPGQMFPLNARIRHLDADRFVVEMLSNAPDGSSYVMLETTYTRDRE